MSFQDIFQSSFLEKLQSVSLIDMVLSLALAFFLGLFIFFVYKKTYAGVMYSANFGITLVALSLITSLLIMTVVSNVVLSLGMVGALSIVRFRTAIKEPVDIAFLFWSIAVGIVLAAGLVLLAVLGSAFIGAVLLVFGRRKKVVDTPFILIVQCDSDEWEEQARALVEKSVRRMNLKSKSVEGGRVELNYEVRLQEGSSRFVNELDALPGVSRAVLVSYNGDYMN